MAWTPQRSLGLTSATALVVANMIGAGVFTTSGFLLADLGSPWYVLAAWAVRGVQAALGAMCYGGRLRGASPNPAAKYLFLSPHPAPCGGIRGGWLSLLVGFSAPLARRLSPSAPTHGLVRRCPASPGGTVLILGLCGLHAAEVRRGAQVQNGAVLAKVIPDRRLCRDRRLQDRTAGNTTRSPLPRCSASGSRSSGSPSAIRVERRGIQSA